MPTYEYECGGCGHRLEALQSFSDKPLRKCPECGKRKLTRLIGAGGGLIFKGTGFYITDYRDQSYHDAAKADRAPEPAKAGPATDAKGGAKTEPAKDSGTTRTKAEPDRGPKAAPESGGKPAPTRPASSGNSGNSGSSDGPAAGTRKK